jgi:hypothetical protein
MNERIRELADRIWADEYWSNPNTDKLLPAQLNKFAELIVRECVKFCEHESNDDEHDEYDMGMWVKAESIKTAIKQHFGVEE